MVRFDHGSFASFVFIKIIWLLWVFVATHRLLVVASLVASLGL